MPFNRGLYALTASTHPCLHGPMFGAAVVIPAFLFPRITEPEVAPTIADASPAPWCPSSSSCGFRRSIRCFAMSWSASPESFETTRS